MTLVRLWYIIIWPQSQWPIEAHIPHMLGFRQRYMNGSKACRFWENMVKDLEINAIVPQHGSLFIGDKMVNQFIHWVENLECGLNLFTQENYQTPQ